MKPPTSLANHYKSARRTFEGRVRHATRLDSSGIPVFIVYSEILSEGFALNRINAHRISGLKCYRSRVSYLFLFVLLFAALNACAATDAPVDAACRTHFDTGVAAYRESTFQDAIDAFASARECWLELSGGRDTRDTAQCLNYTGLILDTVGQYENALEFYSGALEITLELSGAQSTDAATLLNNIGEVHRKLGRPDKALDYYHRALELDRTAFGEQHANTARDINNIGAAYLDLGDNTKALEQFQATLFRLAPGGD